MSKSYKNSKLKVLNLIHDKIYSLDPLDPDNQDYVRELQCLSEEITEDSFAEIELKNLFLSFDDLKKAC